MLAAVTRSSSLRYLPFPTRSQNLWMSILFRLQCLLPLLRASHHRASLLRPQTVPSRRFPHPPRVPTGGSLRQNPEPKPDWWFCSRALLKTLFFVDLLKISTLWKSLLSLKSFPAEIRSFTCAFFPSTVPGFFQATSGSYELNLLFF